MQPAKSSAKFVFRYPGWVSLIPALLFAAWVGISNLNADALYADEYKTVYHLGLPLENRTPARIVASLTEISPQHPPGYFFILSGWARLVGPSQVVLRYFSVLWGLAGIAIIYRLGRLFVSGSASIIAAWLISISAFYGYYLHEMRMYTMLAATVALLLWLYVRILRAPGQVSRIEWLGLFGAALVALYTSYLAIFVLGAIGLYHLRLPKTRRWLITAAVLMAAGVLFLPWVHVVVLGVNDHISDGLTGLNPLRIILVVFYLFGNGNYITAVLCALLVGLGAVQPRLRLLTLITLVTIVLFLVANYFVDLMPARRARYLLFLWPMLAVLFAGGLLRLGRPRLAPIVLGVIFAAGLVFPSAVDFEIYNNRESKHTNEFPPFPEIVSGFIHHDIPLGSDDFIIVYSDILQSRHLIDESEYYFQLLHTDGIVMRPDTFSKKGLLKVLTPLEDRDFIWYVPQPDDPQEAIHALIDQSHHHCETFDLYGSVQVERWVRRPFDCTYGTLNKRELATFGQGLVKLVDIHVYWAAPQTLLIASAWEVSDSLPLHQYSFSLRLLAEDGSSLGQGDTGLPSPPTASWRSVSISMAATPSQPMRVQLIVYDWQTGARLAGSAAGSESNGEVIDIGMILPPQTVPGVGEMRLPE